MSGASRKADGKPIQVGGKTGGRSRLIQGDIDRQRRGRYRFGEFCRLEQRFWANSTIKPIDRFGPLKAWPAGFEFQKGSKHGQYVFGKKSRPADDPPH